MGEIKLSCRETGCNTTVHSFNVN